MSAEAKSLIRPTGASAVLRPRQSPVVTSATGGEVTLSSHVSTPGFSPVDLLYGALAGCLVISARAAAAKLGVLEKLGDVEAKVTGRKAAEGLSRVETFHVEIEIGGDIDPAVKKQIAEAAEDEICTVSNTLRGHPSIEALLVDSTAVSA
ncbi:OsmC family protein [Mesorhizobium sp. LHD-90]|uniref:OsmC family protein n=1 Tax=Mesorhizobium sp. LHD-90 TaxID=3071414 RepID=UPI0027E1762D|nr:OsmC family protein [Mesorhizobium sp. LHD-90]MDQ6433603.1 OsmC family protein [Mesorhizobium sp. LHD-90]